MLYQTDDLVRIYNYDQICFQEEAYSWELLNRLTFQMHTKCYLIIYNQVVVGYMMLRFEDEICDIVRLCIFKEYRRQGYAYQTLHTLIHHPKSYNLIFTLNVSATNEIAHKLYYKVGFKDYVELKNYYRNGSSAISMYYDTTKSIY